MKFNNLIQEASQEIVTNFNSFYDEIKTKKEILNYGDLRMREIYPSNNNYSMQFQLKPKYSNLENSDENIKYIIRLLKDIAVKYNQDAKVKREIAINNQAVIKIIFKDIQQGENMNKENNIGLNRLGGTI